MRARTDQSFSEFLLRLTVKHCYDAISEESIIKEIFPSLQENVTTTKYVTERAILASINAHVDNLNDKLISLFQVKSRYLIALTQ
ncbi:hypothetical protein H5410_036531 [Solanum commersonii]|uniref:Uncharacterized protein n=1 Tax=Solanum commersonii TaxID=4109 RepID=A0A9J5Y3S5_SOLCO|nr:hypothetical protein H5410_036531 [Solanum commersonii]